MVGGVVRYGRRPPLSSPLGGESMRSGSRHRVAAKLTTPERQNPPDHEARGILLWSAVRSR
jgi:hypothetical protein